MRALLAAEEAADSCEFGPTLANHLPMALIALDRLGASAGRMAQFADNYRLANRLIAPPPRIAAISWDDWTAHLGDRTRQSDYRAFFAAELSKLGAAELQRRALSTLLPGVAASALHALMRLAYANFADTPDDIATALGYWSATYLPLRQGEAARDTADPADVLARLRGHSHLLRIEPETDLLWHAMRAVGHDPRFAAELDRFDAHADSLPTVAAAALALFVAADDFCSLHALTSMHWLRLIPPNLIDRGAALRHLWRALAAVYPKMGMPDLPTAEALDELRHAPCPSWGDICAATVASDDEHDISLVFSAREEERVYGDPLYRRVAARRIGLL